MYTISTHAKLAIATANPVVCRRTKALDIIGLALLLGVTACDHPDDPGSPELEPRNAEPTHYRIPDCAKEPLQGDIITIEDSGCGDDDKSVIENIKSNIAVGDVVTYMSGEHAIARHVTGILCNGKELTTEAAHLGHVANAAKWGDQEVDDLASHISGSIAKAHSAGPSTTTLEYEGLRLDIDVAAFEFKPDLSFDLRRSGFSIDDFKMSASVTPNVALGFKATADKDLPDLTEIAESIGLEDLTEKELFTPVTYEEVILVGDVPVLTVTTFAVYLGLEAEGDAHAALAGHVELSGDKMEIGVGYDGNDWSLETPSLSLNPSGELDTAQASGRLKIRLKLRGTVSVDIYDLVGPELSFIPYAELDAKGDQSSYEARLDMGIDGSVGIETTLFHWFGKSLRWEDKFHIVDQRTVWSSP
jgi:hypothetical protein